MNPSNGQIRLAEISELLENNKIKDEVSEIVRKYENKSVVNETQLEIIINLGNHEQFAMLHHHKTLAHPSESLIMYAVENDLLSTVQKLIENDGELKYRKDSKGNAPIHVALKLGRKAIAEFLMEFPANLEDLDSEGNTVLHLAAESKLNTIFLNLRQMCAAGKIFERNIHNNNCIHVALQSGNTELVRSIFKQYNINYEVLGFNNNTYLHFAAIGDCDEEMLKFLISKVSDINCTNLFRRTPFHEALLNGSEKAARLLYDNGSDVNLYGTYNENCFHFAAQGNCSDMIKVLKNTEVHIDTKSILGLTPLHVALAESKVETIKELITIKANLNILDMQGNSIFHYVAKRNLPELLNHLDEKSPLLYEPNRSGYTPLHTSIKYDSYKMFKFLSKCNKNINKSHWKTKNTPLHTAAISGNWCYVYGLLLNGADPNARNEDGHTPIQLALLHDHEHCVEILLLYADKIHTHFCKKGYGVMHYATKTSTELMIKIIESNRNCTLETINNITKKTLYHSAIKYNNLEVIEFLINHNICQTGNIDQVSPLHLAGRSGNAKIFGALSTELHSTDMNAKDKNGKAVVDYIMSSGNKKVLDCYIAELKVRKKPLELSHLKNNKNALHYVVKKGRLDIIFDTLLNFEKLRQEIDNLDSHGFAPIHYAVKYGNLKAVECLISFGSNKNVIDVEKRTPLHLAVIANDIEIVKYLVKIGVNINQQDGKGWTAVHYAVGRGHKNILIYLIQNHADTNLNTEKQCSPLEMATLLNRVKMMEILISCDHNINTKKSYDKTVLEVVARSARSYDVLEFIENYEGPNYDIIKLLSEDIEDIL